MRKITFLFLCFTGLTFGQTAVPVFPTSGFSGHAFGKTLAMQGDDIAISTSFAPFFPSNKTGKVYLFNNLNGIPAQTATLFPEGLAENDGFGTTLSFGGDFLAVGAPNHESGSVYLYSKNEGNWNLVQTIDGSSVSTSFGSHVKIYNDYLFITEAGKVMIYKLSANGEWTFHQEFPIATSKIIVANGVAVLGTYSLEGGYSIFTRLILGNDSWTVETTTPAFAAADLPISDFAYSNGELYTITGSTDQFFPNVSGSVSRHTYLNNEWNSNVLFTAGAQSDQIYTKIDVSGDDMYIGSTAYILAMTRKFPLLHYKKTDTTWTYNNTLYGTSTEPGDDYFGQVTAIDGDNLLVGSYNEGFIGYGMAYVFDMTLGTKQFDSNSFSVYPNPTNDILNVASKTGVDVLNVAIYSLSGKLLIEKKSSTISIGSLATGMYLAEITAMDGSIQTIKIIKN